MSNLFTFVKFDQLCACEFSSFSAAYELVRIFFFSFIASGLVCGVWYFPCSIICFICTLEDGINGECSHSPCQKCSLCLLMFKSTSQTIILKQMHASLCALLGTICGYPSTCQEARMHFRSLFPKRRLHRKWKIRVVKTLTSSLTMVVPQDFKHFNYIYLLKC